MRISAFGQSLYKSKGEFLITASKYLNTTLAYIVLALDRYGILRTRQ